MNKVLCSLTILFVFAGVFPVAAAEPIDSVAEAVKGPLGLVLESCPDQEIREATKAGYQVLCAVTAYGPKEFHKQMKLLLKRNSDLDLGGDLGPWDPPADLSRYSLWYRDMALILTYHKPSGTILLILRHTMQACSTPAPEPPEGDNIVPPVPPHNDRVYYPEAPNPDQKGHRVRVRVRVNTDGTKSALCIVNPDTKALEFNYHAIDIAQRVPYQPATSNGEPIPMEVEVIALFPYFFPGRFERINQ